jgi:hypothetical protein
MNRQLSNGQPSDSHSAAAQRTLDLVDEAVAALAPRPAGR